MVHSRKGTVRVNGTLHTSRRCNGPFTQGHRARQWHIAYVSAVRWSIDADGVGGRRVGTGGVGRNYSGIAHMELERSLNAVQFACCLLARW